MNPVDLVGAAPWQRTVFTTYALSLAFFEGVILDQLVRGGAKQATILSDPEGIRAALQEQGARGVGREYELEPVACTTGAFHAKVSCFQSEDDCHLLVGSGNLTFGGWGGNLEVFEHLHPSFAADAFRDAADFFEYLSIADNVRWMRPSRLEPLVAALRRAAATGSRNGNVRMLSSLEGALADQIGALADDLGGARRLTLVSPYFDRKGAGLKRLTARLGLDRCYAHVHDDVVHGHAGAPWPFEAEVDAVIVDEPFGADTRRLHAKCFEVICGSGRLIVAGSANATQAALVNGNIETVVARIQRNRLKGWSIAKAEPPPEIETTTTDENEREVEIAVLAATLEGNTLQGTVLSSFPVGEATIAVRTAIGPIALGPVLVDSSGSFTVSAKDLEAAAWSGGRMTAVISNGERRAEGFVALGDAMELMRRGGAMAPRIFEMLMGNETPVDAAAVLSWFAQNLELLLCTPVRGKSTTSTAEGQPLTITSVMLHGTETISERLAGGPSSSNGQAWERAMSALLASLSTGRQRWDDLSDDDDPDEVERITDEERHRENNKREKAKQRVVASFEKLLDSLLRKERPAIALSLAVYVVSRAAPAAPRARTWFNRIITAYGTPPIHRDALLTDIKMLLIASDGRPHSAARAREYLQECGLDPVAYEVGTSSLVGLIGVFCEGWDAGSFMKAARQTRSPAEEITSLLAAAGSGRPTEPFPILMASRHWSRLEAVLKGQTSPARLVVVDHLPKSCPHCHLNFTPMAADELRFFGVTEHCRLVVRAVPQ